MAKLEQQIKKVSASDARQQFASMINEIAREGTRVVIEKNGAPVAAVLSINDFLHLRSLEVQSPEITALFERMSEPFRDVPPEEIEAETERILAEIREEDRLARRKAATGA